MNEEIALSGIEELFPATPAARRRYKTIMLPVSGLNLRIQSLTERELSNYQASAWKAGKTGQEMDPQKLKTSGARLIVLCVVDGRKSDAQ